MGFGFCWGEDEGKGKVLLDCFGGVFLFYLV